MHRRRVVWQATMVAVAVWLVVLPTTGSMAAASAKRLVLVGTVTEITGGHNAPLSAKIRGLVWLVTVNVDAVKVGRYSQSTFTFSIHSPARAGLAVGRRYTIEATWNGAKYVVDETRPFEENRKEL